MHIITVFCGDCKQNSAFLELLHTFFGKLPVKKRIPPVGKREFWLFYPILRQRQPRGAAAAEFAVSFLKMRKRYDILYVGKCFDRYLGDRVCYR